MKIADKGLGKGLDALIKPDFYEQKSQINEVTSISLNKINPNPNQPRTDFEEDKISELSESVKRQGVLQPILVRKNDQGEYQIIAGERRWRASVQAGLKTIPAIIKEYSDTEALAIALIENLQREDLNIVEQAKALDKLKNDLKVNQDELASKIGKSRSNLANTLRLLNLPDEILNMIQKKEISAGHARAMLGLKNKDQVIWLGKEIAEKGLSVRACETLIKKLNQDKKTEKKKNEVDEDFCKEMQKKIKERLNEKIKVKIKGNRDKGQLTINYTDKKQLEDVLRVISSEKGSSQ